MVKLASKTMQLIEQMLEADQGASYRLALRQILPKIEDAYRGVGKPFRKHLGASMIGQDCSRRLYYNFRWVAAPKSNATLIRLFNRGHLEEGRFLALFKILEGHGIEFWYETPDGGQFKFSDVHGHFGSALDGVVRGIPDLPPGIPAYTEFKTSAEKGFKKLQAEGMQSAKYEHFIQCQICMHKMNLPHTLYMVVNKNTDEIYAEIIDYDQTVAESFIQRASNIIYSRTVPERISDNPTWYLCSFCSYKDICHKGAPVDINCRTCKFASPSKTGDGLWECENGYNSFINSDKAMEGCEHHCLVNHFR